jgi:hypothetical protein
MLKEPDPYPIIHNITIIEQYDCKVIMCRSGFDYNIISNDGKMYGTNNKTIFNNLKLNQTYCIRIPDRIPLYAYEIGKVC